MGEEYSDFMRNNDSLRNRILHTEPYIEHNRLKSYALMRDSCINSEGKKLDVIVNEDIREKYMYAYEKISGTWITTNYKEHQKHIFQKKAYVNFWTQRPLIEEPNIQDFGHIIYNIIFGPDSIELDVGFEVLRGSYNESWFTAVTFLDENKVWRNMSTGFHQPKYSGQETLKDFERTLKYTGLEFEKVDIDNMQMIYAILTPMRTIK
jgi:hypothetical protein